MRSNYFTNPESLRQTEDEISLVCNRKQMSIYDMQPPQISIDQVLVRRTIDRRTGVVMAEENIHELSTDEQTRRFVGKVPKKVLTIFFYWDGARVLPAINAVKATKGKSQYLTITNGMRMILNSFLDQPTEKMWVREFEPSPTEHTLLFVASERSGKFVTNVTTAVGHEIFAKCHKLAPNAREISLSKHHCGTFEQVRHSYHIRMSKIIGCFVITTSFGDWTGGVLQIDEEGTWTDHDSRDAWLCLMHEQPGIKLPWCMALVFLLHTTHHNNFTD